MLIINDRISRLQTYEYLDVVDVKIALLKADSRALLESIGEEALKGVPQMKGWLEDDTGNNKVSVVLSNNTAIQVTVTANMRLLEATIFEVFLYECIASQAVPKRDRLVRIGCLFTDRGDRTFQLDSFVAKIMLGTHRTPIYTHTVYEAFHACCCDYVAVQQSVAFTSLKKRTYDATDRLTSFIRLYTVMGLYYDGDSIADIMKSVCLLVATPAIANALYTAMLSTTAKCILDNWRGGDRRVIVLSSLLDTCQGVESSISWIEEMYRNKLVCTTTHDQRFGHDLSREYPGAQHHCIPCVNIKQ
jgi:hypothetical protein